MNMLHRLNMTAYVVALLLAGISVVLSMPRAEPTRITATPTIHGVDLVVMPDGTPGVRDARGAIVPIREHQRVVTLDLVSDELVCRFFPLSRVVGVSAWAQGPEAWRLAGLPRMAGLNDLESLLALKPDLVLVSTSGSELDRIQRLRDLGIAVFDLGPAGGARELGTNIRRVSALLGVAERGEDIAAQFEHRLAQVSAHIPTTQPRRRALVLMPASLQVYGGTTGSSFHDMLTAAGLIDAAAGQFAEPWPLISAEQALIINPDVIVTRHGATALLQRIPGFARLRALTHGAVIELPEVLFDSPGLSLLDAAETLCDKAYPDARRK